MYSCHVKAFERANIRAVIDHAGITVGYRTPDARVGEIGCSFYHGADDALALPPDQLCLDDVDAVAISEVMADLAYVVSG
jgi:hypothetical protein